MFAKSNTARFFGALAATALVTGCTTTPKVDPSTLVQQPVAPPPEPTPDERFAVAQAAYDQGDCAAAQPELAKVLEKVPDHVDALYLSARCHDLTGGFDAAITGYQQVLAADAAHEEALLGLGAAYKRSARYDDAIALYTKALEADPENVKLRNNLGVLYRLAGQYAEAEAAFRRVLARKQGDVDAYKNLVVLYMAQDKLVLAEQFSLEARKIDEKDSGIWTNLGLIWFKRDPQKPTRALDAFFKAVELDDKNVAAHENIAAIALRFRDYETAAEHASKAVAYEPQSWQAHLALAYALDGQRKVPEAVASYDKALALRPVTDELTADIVWSKGMLFKAGQDWANFQQMLLKYQGMEGLNAKNLARLEGELQGVEYMLKLQTGGDSNQQAIGAPQPEPEPAPAPASEEAPVTEAANPEEAPATEAAAPEESAAPAEEAPVADAGQPTEVEPAAAEAAPTDAVTAEAATEPTAQPAEAPAP